MNTTPTYEHYGSILKNTPFENKTDSTSYIPYSDDFSALSEKVFLGRNKYAPNSICYQPMEGQDAENGTPTDITFKRYTELANGGAGLIWLEAVSVCPEGRSNPYQLMLTSKNRDEFSRLAESIKTECLKQNGYEPVIILQLTNSGRYSKPNGTPSPIAAYVNPDIDSSAAPKTASDEYLASLPEMYAKSAALAEKCGYDGVDLKCCHGYLLSELLSAFDRDGIYGGSFENRTRLLFDCAAAIDGALGENMIRACRLNVYDGYPGKYCFGKSSEEGREYDLTEPNAVISRLEKDFGFTLINVTMGSPYRNPDVSRPYKRGIDMPKTNAVQGLSRILGGCAEIKKAHPDTAFVDTGISALGALSPFAAAGLKKEDMTDFVGFGRMSFAYPSLARDIINGSFDGKKSCVACGGCSYLKKNVQKSGCIIRNRFYSEIYKDYKKSHND